MISVMLIPRNNNGRKSLIAKETCEMGNELSQLSAAMMS